MIHFSNNDERIIFSTIEQNNNVKHENGPSNWLLGAVSITVSKSIRDVRWMLFVVAAAVVLLLLNTNVAKISAKKLFTFCLIGFLLLYTLGRKWKPILLLSYKLWSRYFVRFLGVCVWSINDQLLDWSDTTDTYRDFFLIVITFFRDFFNTIGRYHAIIGR